MLFSVLQFTIEVITPRKGSGTIVLLLMMLIHLIGAPACSAQTPQTQGEEVIPHAIQTEATPEAGSQRSQSKPEQTGGGGNAAGSSLTVLPGPLEKERQYIVAKILYAKRIGCGTQGYERGFKVVQDELLSGGDFEAHKLRLRRFEEELDEQIRMARELKTYEPIDGRKRKLPLPHATPDPVALARASRLAKAIVAFGLRSAVTKKAIQETLVEHPDTVVDVAYALQDKLNKYGYDQYKVIFANGYLSIRHPKSGQEVKLMDL